MTVVGGLVLFGIVAESLAALMRMQDRRRRHRKQREIRDELRRAGK